MAHLHLGFVNNKIILLCTQLEFKYSQLPQSELAGVATVFYMPARISCDRQQDSKVARSSARGGDIRVSE